MLRTVVYIIALFLVMMGLTIELTRYFGTPLAEVGLFELFLAAALELAVAILWIWVLVGGR